MVRKSAFVDATLTMWSHASLTPKCGLLHQFLHVSGGTLTQINCLGVIKMDFSCARSEKVPKDTKVEEDKERVYLSDIRQLQDVREDVEAWGLQQRADSLGQC